MLIVLPLLCFLLLLTGAYCGSKAYIDLRMRNTGWTVWGVVASLTALATSIFLMLVTALSFSGV
jgi:hypothetical protein